MSHLSPQIVKDYLRYGVPDKKNGETLADLKRSSVFRPGKVADGHSLFLMVRRRALGFWIGQYRNGSSFNSTGLGSAAEVSPAAARRRWEDYRAARRNGTLHGALRDQLHGGVEGAGRAATGASTGAGSSHNREFGTAVVDYLVNHANEWGPKQLSQKRHLVETYLRPIANVRCRRLTAADIAAVIRPVWTGTGSNRGTRLLGLIANTLGAEEVSPNPAAWITMRNHLSKDPAPKVPHASMSWKDVPTLWSKLAADDAPAARAFKLLTLCGTRADETLSADWREFDLDAKIWTIPAAHRKLKKVDKANPDNFHKVPLSDATIAVLGPKGQALVFKPSRGVKLGNDAFDNVFKPLGFIDPVQHKPATVHGMRSTLGDWGRDNKLSDDVDDCALAHKQVGKRASYFRATRFDERRELADAWAAYVTK